jgi:hypothetical protein
MNEKELEEAFKNLSIFDELSEDEILYYATPYFDELMAQKEERRKKENGKENTAL